LKRSYCILALCATSLIPVPAFADLFSFTGGEQQFTVTTTGEYQIVAYGAQGGNGYANTTGGLGAEIGGDFNLTAGQVIDIFVGQQGGSFLSDPGAGGGGGGTFVAIDASGNPGDLLAVAGGGGGAGWVLFNGNDANTDTSGGQGGSAGADGGAPGGTGGSGGGASNGAGGGGYTGGGAAASGGCGASGGGAGFPTLSGGVAGAGTCQNGNGGYGGGGAAGGGAGSGGGGGGYSGGGGGGGGFIGPGGGGGSFLDASATNQLELVGNTGDGFVTIDPLVAAVPEPSSLALFGIIVLLAIPSLRRLKRRIHTADNAL
jgi:hypothetical protein